LPNLAVFPFLLYPKESPGSTKFCPQGGFGQALFDNWRNDQWQGIFSPGEDDLTQTYCMYVKENRQSMAEKDPPVGVLTIFKQRLVRKHRISQ